jgi:hypothetical protein
VKPSIGIRIIDATGREADCFAASARLEQAGLSGAPPTCEPPMFAA